jgi:hypothetical protein
VAKDILQTIKEAKRNFKTLSAPYAPFEAGKQYAIIRLLTQPQKTAKAESAVLMPDGKGGYVPSDQVANVGYKVIPLALVLVSEDESKRPGDIYTVPANEVTGVMINPKWEAMRMQELRATGGMTREATDDDSTRKWSLNLDEYWGRYLFPLPYNEEFTKEDKHTFRVPLLKLQSKYNIQ